MKKANILIISIAFALIVGVLIVFFAAIGSFGVFEEPQEISEYEMNRYIAVCTNPQMDGWKDMKVSLERSAAANNAAIEFLEEGFDDDRADASCIEMAVDSGVDGIVIYANDGDFDAELKYAAENSVPVVSVIDSRSHENVFEIGTDHALFAKRMVEYVDEMDVESKNVAIISSGQYETHRSEQLSELFGESGRNVVTRTFSGPHVFDANETVKALIASEEKIDMICCLDATATLGVAQAIVELNKVNVISIVGCGKSEEILNMIRKGVVAATFAVDYERIAREAIATINNAQKPFEYDKRMISNIYVINGSNADAYIEEAEQ